MKRFAIWFCLHASLAFAAPEEIQVYMDEMDAPGQFGLDVHNNTVLSGSGASDYPGAVPPVHVYRMTPEFSYGLTENFELGAYFLSSYSATTGPAYDGTKLRIKYIATKEPGQTDFWGANLEVGKLATAVSQAPWNAELKGIYGFRQGKWTVAFNANLAWSLSGPGALPPSLELDSKVAWSVKKDLALGFESYNGVGPVRRMGYLGQESQTLYAVVDTAVAGWDLNLGLGRGLSSVSDQWILKGIVGVPF
ncbi:MAG: hypothetical protein HKL98_11415 [Burkholderiales bacterium]|nr:hypothetical protein [Burkholderiales bacterium]